MAVLRAGRRNHALPHAHTLGRIVGILLAATLTLSITSKASALPPPQASPTHHHSTQHPPTPRTTPQPATHTFTGDTLQIPANSQRTDNRTFIADAAAQFHIAENATLHLTGPLQNAPYSREGLHKTGHGTLILANASTLQGNTVLYQGTLQVRHPQALGWQGRTLQLAQGTRLEYTDGLTVANSLQVSHLHLPKFMPTDPPKPGQPDDIQWLVPQGSAIHRASIIGDLPIIKRGQGDLVLNGNALPYLGHFQLTEGGLMLNNMMGAPLTAGPGTRLAGDGRVSQLRLTGNVLFAPGLKHWPATPHANAATTTPSTFIVAGDAHLHRQSTLWILARPDGTSNQLQIDNTAHLDGHLHIQAEGDWQKTVSYDIIKAGNIAPGTAFADYRLNRDDLDSTLAYRPDRVILTLSPKPAQPWQLHHTTDATLRSLMLDDSRFLREAVLRQQRHGLTMQGQPRTWLQALTVHGKRSGNGGSGARHHSSVILGQDIPIRPLWHISLYGGAGHTGWHPHGEQPTASYNTMHLGFAVNTRQNAWHMTAGFAYSRHRVKGNASLQHPQWQQTLRTRHDARIVQLFASVARHWQYNNNTSLTPYIEAAWVGLRTPPRHYHGGQTSLRSARSSDQMHTAKLGLRVQTHMQPAKTPTPWTLHADLAWRYTQTSGTTRANWQGIARNQQQWGSATSDIGIARHALQTQIGAAWQPHKQWQFTLDYAGQYARGDNDHQWILQGQYRF